MKLTLEIDDKVEVSENEALLALAIKLYIDEQLTLYQAAKLCQLTWYNFQGELAKRKIPTIHTSSSEIMQQFELAKSL